MHASTLPEPAPAWWRYPIMWLVVGAPLFVVVGGTAVAVVAVSGADAVVGVPKLPVVRSAAPAVQGRNHAATPLPADRAPRTP